jgi:hypothetical protein
MFMPAQYVSLFALDLLCQKIILPRMIDNELFNGFMAEANKRPAPASFYGRTDICILPLWEFRLSLHIWRSRVNKD